VATTQAVFYCDKHGVEPVGRFVDALPGNCIRKIDECINENLNGKPADAPPPQFPVSSQIEGGLRELRVRVGKARFRILYQRSGNLIVLLHAFVKNTNAVPKSEKTLAHRRMADFKQRMDAKIRVPPRAAGRDAPPGSRR
jgi:phage-related protein